MGTIHASFDTLQAQRVAGITQRQIIYWAKTGLVVPSIFRSSHPAPGMSHQYSLNDLCILKAVKRLKDNGIPIQTLRKVAQRLKDFEGKTFNDLYLTGDGKKDVLLREQGDLVSLLRNPGQLVFAWVLNMADVEKEVRNAVERMAA